MSATCPKPQDSAWPTSLPTSTTRTPGSARASCTGAARETRTGSNPGRSASRTARRAPPGPIWTRPACSRRKSGAAGLACLAGSSTWTPWAAARSTTGVAGATTTTSGRRRPVNSAAFRPSPNPPWPRPRRVTSCPAQRGSLDRRVLSGAPSEKSLDRVGLEFGATTSTRGRRGARCSPTEAAGATPTASPAWRSARPRAWLVPPHGPNSRRNWTPCGRKSAPFSLCRPVPTRAHSPRWSVSAELPCPGFSTTRTLAGARISFTADVAEMTTTSGRTMHARASALIMPRIVLRWHNLSNSNTCFSFVRRFSFLDFKKIWGRGARSVFVATAMRPSTSLFKPFRLLDFIFRIQFVYSGFVLFRL